MTSAISVVEQALWDIKGKYLGALVYQLLGGKLRDRIELYTHTLFGNQSPEEFAVSARQAVALGFRAIKCDPLGNAQQLRDAGIPPTPGGQDRPAEEHARSRKRLDPGSGSSGLGRGSR